VVSAGATVQQALADARKKGVKTPVLTRMPQDIKSFVGSHRKV
jgi:hypothetical protein